MLFEIRNNKIVSDTSAVLGLTKLNNKISVLTDAPIDSVIFLKINGFKNEYVIPMYIERTEETGHIFSCEILFTSSQIDFINSNPKQVYNCSFEINRSNVEGSFKFTIYSVKFAYQNKTNLDIIGQIVKDLAEIKSYIYVNNKTETNTLFAVDIAKGMVPIATGIGNEYKWDYPLVNVYDKLKDLSKLVLDLSEQNTQLVQRINELETKINDHVYEQYVL